MKTSLEYILIIIAVLLAGIFIRLLVSLLFRYARIYITSDSRQQGQRRLAGRQRPVLQTRILVGYLIPNKQGDLVFYSGLLPLLRHRKGVIVKQSNVSLQKINDDFNYAEAPAGFVDTASAIVSNEFGTFVADLKNGKCRDSSAVIGDIELGYAKGSIRSKGKMSPYGAAIGALLHKQQEAVKRTPDVSVGFGDLFLPSTFIYLLLFPLFRLFDNTNLVLYPLLLVGSYPVILFVLFLIKHAVTMRNGSFKWTSIIDDNVGMIPINIIVLIASAILCIFCILGIADVEYIFPTIYIILAIIANWIVLPRFRKITDPYDGWSGQWRKPSFKPGRTPSSDLKDITFSWVNILANKGITGNDKTDSVTLQLPRSDYEGNDPRVRKRNPFYDPQLTDEGDREDFTMKVLDGADIALKKDGETEVHEDKVLTQIVNSAFQICKRYNLADFEMFDLILLFCEMNIKYKVDEECESINNNEEYYRFASETLYDETGDCDCKAVLGYKLFELLGVKPDLVSVKTGGSANHNHAAIVLHNDPNAVIQLPPQYKEYEPGKGVYCEATSDGGFHPGDLPKDIDTSSMVFYNRKRTSA